MTLVLPTFSGRFKKGILTLIGALHEQTKSIRTQAVQVMQPSIQAGDEQSVSDDDLSTRE